MTQYLRLALAASALAFPTAALADEGGATLYLLGSGGPGAAVMPPLPGIYLDKTTIIYGGGSTAERQFVIGGNVVADIDATMFADFVTAMWVPTTNFAGGTLAVAGSMAVGGPSLNAGVVLTGPGGQQIGVSRHDSTFTVGDPVMSMMLGWKTGNWHIQASTILNIPIGHYREGELANLSFHRWAFDGSMAVTWLDPASGIDVSAKAGVTFNGRNDVTDYDSGNELHLEAAVEKKFSERFSAGIQAYYLTQISDDTGSGAKLGPYRGEVAGVGLTAATSVELGETPASLRFRIFQEFDAKNRLEGTSAMLSISFPLSMKLPPQ